LIDWKDNPLKKYDKVDEGKKTNRSNRKKNRNAVFFSLNNKKNGYQYRNFKGKQREHRRARKWENNNKMVSWWKGNRQELPHYGFQ
jgi:hypothetical protein